MESQLAPPSLDLADLKALVADLGQGPLPLGIMGSPWAVAACGSTALGIEAAFRDLALVPGCAPPLLARSPEEFAGLGLAPGRPVLGLSISGGSSEVALILGRARASGHPTAYLSQRPGTAQADFSWTIPRPLPSPRLSPAFSCLLSHKLCASDFLGLPLQAGVEASLLPLLPFLEAARKAGRTPLVVSGHDDFWARALAACHMEFLKAPAFTARYPAWTHDLLWSLGPEEARRFCLLGLGLLQEDSLGRLGRIEARMEGLSLPYLALPSPGSVAGPGTWGQSQALLDLLALFAGLARACGIDPDREASFA